MFVGGEMDWENLRKGVPKREKEVKACAFVEYLFSISIIRFVVYHYLNYYLNKSLQMLT